MSNAAAIRESSPLVSVVTPVFNGAKYLRACIDSVLAQSYRNWDYTIVDNCSTDGSLEIAQEYAKRHPQVTVRENEKFVGLVENHNRAFRSISTEAKYCKLVSADDWIYPECISKLVDRAEHNPSVGVVGSYAANAKGVRWGDVPLDKDVLDGREAARAYLLGSIESFWTPSTVLYRSSLIRATDNFFPGTAPSADLEACLNCLKSSDLGFVHQILSYERIHDEAMTARVREMNSQLLDRIRILDEFGPTFLTLGELESRREAQFAGYFRMLAVACFNFPGNGFWRLHKDGLEELGYSIYSPKFASAIAARFLDLALNPKSSIEKIVRRAKSGHVD